MKGNGSTVERGIKSVGVTFDIIEHLDATGSAGVSEIADSVGVTKSTVHYHLRTMEDRDYVVQENDGRYRLGFKFLKYGRGIQRRERLYSVAKPDVDELIDEIGERAQVMIREKDRGVHIYRVASERAVKTDSDVGTHVHLHATAAGKAYLAELTDEEIESIVASEGLPQFTPQTITSREDLLDEIETVRELGHAFNMEENCEGLRAVGTAIRREDSGEVLGAVSVSGPTTRFTGSYFEEELPARLREVAKVIGIKATYHQL